MRERKWRQQPLQPKLKSITISIVLQLIIENRYATQKSLNIFDFELQP